MDEIEPSRVAQQSTAPPGDPGVRGSILIAEDEEGVRDSLIQVLREEGYDVVATADGTAAIAALAARAFDVVLSDLRMPGADGLAVLRHARSTAPQTAVLLMTAHATVDSAVEGLRGGARDYLLKPVIFDELLHKIAALVDHRQVTWERQFLRHQVDRHWDFDHLVGQSSAMREVMTLIKRVAPLPSTVLITGESGVGKEVVARAIHHFSDRREVIFLPVSCGDVAEPLLESQLFGRPPGSFSDADCSQEGLFQRARGGTVFLDEIGALPLGLQARLLRAIEGKEILPVGAAEPIRIDVRIIAASNRELRHEVEAGRFRDDLYYRLNVFSIEIPPLRERREDIPQLADHFIRLHNRELKTQFKGADEELLALLMSLPWKGNVRELDNVIEHAMILGTGDWITVRDLPRALRSAPELLLASGDSLRAAVRAYERAHIQAVLAKSDNDKRAAAERLGISLSSLYRKIEELDTGLDAASSEGG